MAEKQHAIAARLLPKIFEKWQRGRFPTYAESARFLGRSSNHSRAIAQVCDLLDAAAARARVPLLALWVVRERTGEINPRAFRNNLTAEMKRQVVERSRLHRFTQDDVTAIGQNLQALHGLGNKRAWVSVGGNKSGAELLRFLLGDSTGYADAIHDIGADVPLRTLAMGFRYARDPQVRAVVRERAQGRCELCGKLGFVRQAGGRYLETHHIIALASDGEDRVANVIALCADDHREAHFGERAAEIEREMVRKMQDLLVRE